MSLQNKLRDSNAKRRASGGIRGRLRGLRGEVLEAADGGELLGVHGVQHRRYALRRPFAAPGRRYHCRTVPQTRTERATTFDLHEPILICCFELTAVLFCSVLRVAVCWWQGSVDAHRHRRHGLEQQEAGGYWLRSHHPGGVGSQQLVVLNKHFEQFKSTPILSLFSRKLWAQTVACHCDRISKELIKHHRWMLPCMGTTGHSQYY